MAGINLKVQIEINGQFVQVGHITGSSFRDAAFSYDESYITSSAAHAISLSLPLSKRAFDTDGTVTLYEYDAKGQLATVYYPYTKAMEVALKEEAEENRMPTVAECGINKYLDSGTRNGLSALLNRISWNYGSKILAMQLFIKESYKYDGNGNRIQKITPYGTIDYVYNEENLLVSSGWNGNVGVTYTYDKEGNLLTQESELKIIKYAYNAQNRIMYSEVTDKKEKTHSVSYYGYDAFGRRVIEQDKDEAALRSLYDGFTFDVIKQSPTFANGLFVDSNETGIRISRTGRPTGDRYRYLEDSVQQDGNRYFHLDEGNYRNVSSRYKGSRTALTVNDTIAAQNTDGDISYFTTDLLGSVRTTTDGYGYVDKKYTYDAFGAIIEGDLSGQQNFGYLGKQFDKQTGLYNYGYRDYTPKVARFTTVDPIRDGENWLTYCKNDSVNHVDLWGLESIDSNRYTDNIVEYLISVDNDARSGNNRAKTTGIVIHYTDGARKQGNKEVAQTPKQTIDYWISEQNTSAHFVIGEKGEIYQAIPTEEIAYHAGENKVNKFVPGIQDTLEGHPNTRTIGIEMENNKVSGAFSTQTYNATVQLTAELLLVPVENRHSVTG